MGLWQKKLEQENRDRRRHSLPSEKSLLEARDNTAKANNGKDVVDQYVFDSPKHGKHETIKKEREYRKSLPIIDSDLADLIGMPFGAMAMSPKQEAFFRARSSSKDSNGSGGASSPLRKNVPHRARSNSSNKR